MRPIRRGVPRSSVIHSSSVLPEDQRVAATPSTARSAGYFGSSIELANTSQFSA